MTNKVTFAQADPASMENAATAGTDSTEPEMDGAPGAIGPKPSTPDVDLKQFKNNILSGELEAAVGPELQATFLTTLLPQLSFADWGQASDEEILTFKSVSRC